jgi:hypothetical protein
MEPDGMTMQPAMDHLANQLSTIVFENNDEFGRILNDFVNGHAQVYVH